MFDLSAFQPITRRARSVSAPRQLTLPGLPDPPVATFGLFIAVRPTDDAGERAERVAELLRPVLHRPRGRVRRERLHVTMQHLGYYSEPPSGVTAVTAFILSEFQAARFGLVFDEVVGQEGPLVLRGRDMAEAVAVQHHLRDRLARAGLTRIMRRRGAPHMTLWYEGGVAGACRIEPIEWRASRLVLVRSWLGQGRHERMAECILHG